MSERYKQPESEAEFVHALREAFAAGAAWRVDPWRGAVPGADTIAESRRRYPITRTVPREPVKLPGNAGTVAPVDGKYVSFIPASYIEGSGAYFDAADLDAMRDLLENPTTTVTE